MLPASILPGSPALPFVLRLNMATATYLRIGLWISLVSVAVFWMRVPTLTITAHLYLASLSAVCASSIWWRHCCRHAPFGGSYCRWHEVPAALVRVVDAVLGSSWLWPRAWLDGLVPGSYDGCWLRHVIVMLWASAAPTRLLYWAFTMRIFFALPLHILMAFMLARRNVEVCDSATLATPAAEQHTHEMYQVLNLLRFSLLAPSAQPTLSPRNECAVVLTYLHITLGLALPAVVAARVETRLFALHQRQLSQLGLPREKGWQPRLYGSFERLLDALEWPTVVLIAWMSMGILFDVSLLASDGRLVPGELPALNLHQLSL